MEQPSQATATKHPHADFIAEALKDTSRKIEGQHRSGLRDEFDLENVVKCDESWTFRFADTVKPEITSPLSDHELIQESNSVTIRGDDIGLKNLRAIAIASKIATLKDVAAMPNVTTLTNDSIVDLMRQSPYGSVNSARRVANAALAEFKKQLLSNNSIS